jgi:hypothetical protein
VCKTAFLFQTTLLFETRTFISILVLLLMEPGTSKSDEEKARYDRRIQLRALNTQVAGTLLAG